MSLELQVKGDGTMAWDCYTSRGKPHFWRELGLDDAAAEVAAKCFPESWNPWYGRGLNYPPWYDKDKEAEDKADKTGRYAPLAYRTDAKHPAYWFAQGCDYDEMAARSVAALAMVRLQQEAVPPPPQTDRFAEVAQALLLQGEMQQRLEGPDSYDDQYYDDPQPLGPVPPQREPFNPDDYPRFQTR